MSNTATGAARTSTSNGPISADAVFQASEASFAILTDAMPQMVWSTLPDGYHDYYNARWYEFTGMPVGSTDGEAWNGLFHPDDQDRAWAMWRHSLATGDPYEIEYRLRHHSGTFRWTLGRALPVRGSQGEITRWIGTCTDIDETKRIADLNALLSRELSHRIKNIFAIISGLINLTRRVAGGPRPELAELAQRVAALGRAHEFARPHSEQSASRMPLGTLRGLIGQILEPYAFSQFDRIVIAGRRRSRWCCANWRPMRPNMVRCWLSKARSKSRFSAAATT